MKRPSAVLSLAIRCGALASLLALSACDDGGTPDNGDLAADPAKSPTVTGLVAEGTATSKSGSPTAPGFSFLKGTDETSLSLKELYSAWTTAPRTADQARAVFDARLAALQKLAADPEKAAQSVITDLVAAPEGLLEPFESGMHLLGEFESVKGVDYLHGRALGALPTSTAAPIDTDQHPVAIASHLRRSAVDQLGGLAARGSARAAEKLLDLVQHAELEVKKVAIWAYYASKGPRQRWRARRDMVPRLPLAERYLLSGIY